MRPARNRAFAIYIDRPSLCLYKLLIAWTLPLIGPQQWPCDPSHYLATLQYRIDRVRIPSPRCERVQARQDVFQVGRDLFSSKTPPSYDLADAPNYTPPGAMIPIPSGMPAARPRVTKEKMRKIKARLVLGAVHSNLCLFEYGPGYGNRAHVHG